MAKGVDPQFWRCMCSGQRLNQRRVPIPTVASPIAWTPLAAAALNPTSRPAAALAAAAGPADDCGRRRRRQL